MTDGWDITFKIARRWFSTEPHWWSVNIGSGNGLVPSGNKPLPESVLTAPTSHYLSQCYHMASLGYDELKMAMFDKYLYSLMSVRQGCCCSLNFLLNVIKSKVYWPYSWNVNWNSDVFIWKKCICKCVPIECHFVQALCVNSLRPSDAYMRRWTVPSLFQIMACRLVGAKPLSKPMLKILSIGPLGTNFNELSIGIQIFYFKKMHFKMASAEWRPFSLGLNVLILVCYFSLQWWTVSFRALCFVLVISSGKLVTSELRHTWSWICGQRNRNISSVSTTYYGQWNVMFGDTFWKHHREQRPSYPTHWYLFWVFAVWDIFHHNSN